MSNGLSVRRAVEKLRYKTSQQRQLVYEMRDRADGLTASGRTVSRAKRDAYTQQMPPSLCFVEVSSVSDLQRDFTPDGLLSGVAVAVSDALDVRGFRTRYGTESQLLQQVPYSEFPFVSWLRRHGAQFVGKLACRTPLTIDEASVIVADCPAAVAVSQKACNYTISSALMGPAALTSPLHYSVASFKPTAQSFATFTENYRLGVPSMSFGITAARLDDIFYLWEVFTSAIQPDSFFDDGKKESTGGSGSGAGLGSGLNARKGNVGAEYPREAADSGSRKTADSVADISNFSKFRRSLGDGYASIRGWRSARGEEEMVGPHIELSVGYPADWIDALCQERLLSGDEFRRRILRLVSVRNSMRKPYINNSMRSIALLLPFSLGGNPMVSLQLEPDFPVALIGELGRDTGLFEDCTTFLQFVQGTSPRWWRRKFMR
uniref:Uncharacterized protein n=1 Tax=Trypanosoma vivax (strain Y486) TaxID=1055687 RepID=G0TVJ6_TRYVY|nr:conserved hypothetical protein, fragment [Trypanosoma vivax Y486]